MRDYRLHELSTQEFQALVVHICQKVLGIGTINFSEGPDGGRDGKFEGTSNQYPSAASPWAGKFIIQAKRKNNPNASCSDADFKTQILDKEIPKIKKLKQDGEIDNYLIFTNRKLTAGAEQKHKNYLKKKTGLTNIAILGVEVITTWLDASPAIVKACNLKRFKDPLRIHSDDIKDVIVAFYNDREQVATEFDSKYSFDYVSLEKKNELNKLSEEYFKYIKENSESFFNAITAFLKKPINKKYADYYYNTIDELKGKIITRKNEFAKFEEIFEHLYDTILDKHPELRESRTLINVFLHYMYCNCDIGEKK
jgi:hypothetical protein